MQRDYHIEALENGRFAIKNHATGCYTAGTYGTRAAAQQVADYLNRSNQYALFHYHG